MNFHRFYDISCILNDNERICLEHAIDGVNLACTETVDAWSYIQLGNLKGDLCRQLNDYDLIPKAIFKAMEQDVHLGYSIGSTVMSLTAIAENYELWRQSREQENSIIEESINFWNSWKTNTLVPYYNSSARGTVYSIGPILEDFFRVRSQRIEYCSNLSSSIEKELSDLLGNSLEEKVSVLKRIVSMGPFPFTQAYYSQLKKRLGNQLDAEVYTVKEIHKAFQALLLAVESRNPSALEAALYPGWYSVAFHLSPLYKDAKELLTALQS